MKQLLQSPSVTHLAENVGMPVTMQEYDLQSQMNSQQLSPSLELVQRNSRNMMVSPESPELSSRTHGSTGGSKR
jgi:hypothetical protein